MTPSIMVQGAGSNVGKSVLVAGLCRIFARRGVRVMPFKPQNMSNNAGVTADGGEIGRAQMLQARGAGVDARNDMNPILLKPESDSGAQIIVQGQRYGTMLASEYGQHKAALMPKVMESYARLAGDAELVIVEGAGSPAETNLRAGDIANMGFAEAADVPVILVGDIDRGGVIASLVGTHQVLDPADAARIKGFVVNKFRGDSALFVDGMQTIAAATGWQNLGIVPWFAEATHLPAEDILDLTPIKQEAGQATGQETGAYHIAVPMLRRIANFEDLDPLMQDPACRVTLVEAGMPLPIDADMVLLPGSKSTIADLEFLREQGWEADLKFLRRHGKAVVGLCGGYQMLGKQIHDPDGIEGKAGRVAGLGLLDVETTLHPKKTLGAVGGVDAATGRNVQGYEIHLGATTGSDCARPMLKDLSDGRAGDGAISADGQVAGCYLHGLFASDEFRRAWLKRAGAAASDFIFEDHIEAVLEHLADHLEAHLDIGAIAKIAGLN